MKKLATLLTLLAGLGYALGQGTTVDFNNGTTHILSGDHKIYLDTVGGIPLVGTNYMAELWYVDPTTHSLTELSSSLSKFRVTTTSAPGTWSGKPVTIPNGGGIGVPIQIDVRVWDIKQGATFDLAKQSGSGYGDSGLFTYTWDPTVPAPADATSMKNLAPFALVPEPSAIALGILGVAGLLIIRRRK